MNYLKKSLPTNWYDGGKSPKVRMVNIKAMLAGRKNRMICFIFFSGLIYVIGLESGMYKKDPAIGLFISFAIAAMFWFANCFD